MATQVSREKVRQFVEAAELSSAPDATDRATDAIMSLISDALAAQSVEIDERYIPLSIKAPLSRAWFENTFRMIDAEASGVPGLTVEQAMAELDKHLAEASAQGGVRVKELEWDRDAPGFYSAASGCGCFYQVRPASGQKWEAVHSAGFTVTSQAETEAEAKAACQSDYERRILSALNTAPVAEPSRLIGGEG